MSQEMTDDSPLRFLKSTPMTSRVGRTATGSKGRPAPPTARGRLSRQRIVAAAERVFGEKGYFPASISDITRAAGVAQGTFYVYFTSKREVFIEVLAGLAHLIRTVTRSALREGQDRLEEERRGFAAFFALVNTRPYLYRIVRQAEFVEDALHVYYESIVPGYVARLRAAMERGEVRRLDPEVLAYCLLGTGDLVGMRWPYWTGKPIPAEVFDSVMEFIQHGMGVDREPHKEVTS
jgi:AcrR family transcriptional regulator